MAKNGKLILVPTPIEELGEITKNTFNELLIASKDSNSIICVEDIRPGRRRWLSWGLPRDYVDNLIAYNEHTRKELNPILLKELKNGKSIFIQSDGGLPAYCDPGEELVKLCHESKIQVSSLSFDNSVVLANALSGFPAFPSRFLGFPPVKKEDRKEFYLNIQKMDDTIIFMDTPYRLKIVIKELKELLGNRTIALYMDLNRESEDYYWGVAKKLKNSDNYGKKEFVCVVGPK